MFFNTEQNQNLNQTKNIKNGFLNNLIKQIFIIGLTLLVFTTSHVFGEEYLFNTIPEATDLNKPFVSIDDFIFNSLSPVSDLPHYYFKTVNKVTFKISNAVNFSESVSKEFTKSHTSVFAEIDDSFIKISDNVSDKVLSSVSKIKLPEINLGVVIKNNTASAINGLNNDFKNSKNNLKNTGIEFKTSYNQTSQELYNAYVSLIPYTKSQIELTKNNFNDGVDIIGKHLSGVADNTKNKVLAIANKISNRSVDSFSLVKGNLTAQVGGVFDTAEQTTLNIWNKIYCPMNNFFGGSACSKSENDFMESNEAKEEIDSDDEDDTNSQNDNQNNNQSVTREIVRVETPVYRGITFDQLNARLEIFEKQLDLKQETIILERTVTRENFTRQTDNVVESIGDSISNAFEGGNNSLNAVDGTFSGNVSGTDISASGVLSGDTILGDSVTTNSLTTNATTTINGELNINDRLTLGGFYGATGQIILSQGTGTAPIWGNASGLSVGNADTLDSLDSLYFLDRANHTGTQTLATISDAGLLASLDGLSTFSTTDLLEGANLYYTDARSRNSISNTIVGLDYSTSTGTLSLNSGYEIPTTASTTEWNNKISSQWINNGSNVYYDSGNVGIGTDSPDTLLEVSGEVKLEGDFGTGGGNGLTIRNTNGSGFSELIFDNNTTPDGLGAFVFGYGGTSTGSPNHAYFWNRRNAPIRFGTNNLERMRIADNGNIGIGTINPTGLLHVNGSNNVLFDLIAGNVVGIGTTNPLSGDDNTNLLDIGGSTQVNTAIEPITSITANTSSIVALQLQNKNSNGEMRFIAAGDSGSYMAFTTPGTTASGSFGGVNKRDGVFWFHSSNSAETRSMNIVNLGNDDIGIGTDNDIQFRKHGGGGFSFGDTFVATDPGSDNVIIEGNVGIGTTNPDELLDVNGNIKWGGSYILTEAVAGAPAFRNVESGEAANFRIQPADRDRTDDVQFNFDILGQPGDSDREFGVLGFRKSGGDRFRIGVGTTGTGNLYPIHFEMGDENPAMVIDTNNNVGIGTDTPLKKLTIEGSGFKPRVLIDTPDTVSFPGLEFRHNGDQNLRALIRSDYESGSPNLTFFTSNSGSIAERMRIEGNGNVGIGTDTPLGTLDITSSGADTPFVINKASQTGIRERLMTAKVSDDSTSSFFINNGTVSNGIFAPVFGGYTQSTTLWPLGFGGFVSSSADASNSSDFGLIDFFALRSTSVNDPLNGTLSNVQNRKLFTFRGIGSQDIYMTVAAGGNVGIGTSNPAFKLDVQGNDANSSTIRTIRFDNGGSPSGFWGIKARGTQASPSAVQSGDQMFRFIAGGYHSSSAYHNSGEMTFTASQTFTAGAAGTDFFLALTPNNSTTRVERFRITQAGNVGIGTSNPQQLLHVVRATDGAPVRFEDANGYCEIDPTSTTWTCTSDERLKDNIKSLDNESVYEKITKLNPVTFQWKTDSSNKNRLGLIAQEVEKIFPDLVNTSEDGYKSVAYGGFTTYLISAVIELGNQVSSLFNGAADLVVASISSVSLRAEKEICIDDVCLDKEALKEILKNSGVDAKSPISGSSSGGGSTTTDSITSNETASTTDGTLVGDGNGGSGGTSTTTDSITSNETASTTDEVVEDSGSSESTGGTSGSTETTSTESSTTEGSIETTEPEPEIVDEPTPEPTPEPEPVEEPAPEPASTPETDTATE